MDWQALQDGLKAWLATASGLAASNVAWSGDPVTMRGYPFADLQLISHSAEPGTDEVRYTDQGADTDLAVEVVGNRRITLSIRVYSRDQRAAYRAYALLEQVRGKLHGPASQEVFRALGLGLRESESLVDVSRVHDGRQESAATLDIVFHWVSAESDAPMGTIETVIVGGTVETPHEVTVPDRTIPQESSP
jgi:hypothetical protein